MILRKPVRPDIQGCVFSSCRKYRYVLTRSWAQNYSESQTVVWIGLNPSTADETKDDPTIRKCIQFSKNWGFKGMVMLNLFAFRATDPKDMQKAKDPVGPDNDSWIEEICGGDEPGLVIAAWGNGGRYSGRGFSVRCNFQMMGVELECLKITDKDEPYHPLYVPYSEERELYRM